MTKTIIFTIAVLTGLMIMGLSFDQVLSAEPTPSAPVPVPYPNVAKEQTAKAIPDWLQKSFLWYGEGKTTQDELLNSLNWMLEKKLLHLSDKAAQQEANMKGELRDMRIQLTGDPDKAFGRWHQEEIKIPPLNQVDPARIPAHTPEWTNLNDADPGSTSTQEALSHLRKAYDLDPALKTKVVQYDDKHDKWIDVLSIDWSSSGDPDRPLISGKVYNTDESDTRTITFTGLESARKTLHDLVSKGDTSTTGWDEGVAAFTSKNYDSSGDSSSIHELTHALGLVCNTALDKEIAIIDAEIAIIQEATQDLTSDSRTGSDPTTDTRLTTAPTEVEQNEDKKMWLLKLKQIMAKTEAVQTGLEVCKAEHKNWEGKLSSIGDDAQLANIDLQNKLQQQQQTLQTLSNVSKMLHDTGMAIIRKIG